MELRGEISMQLVKEIDRWKIDTEIDRFGVDRWIDSNDICGVRIQLYQFAE